MRWARLFLVFATGIAVLLFAATTHASGVEPTKISLPKGPGSIEGLGKNFVPSLASGTATYGVEIAVPPAVGGFGPKLALEYDAGGGVSELGIGWRLGGIPSIRRRVENGLPKFDSTDAFELAGIGVASDLVEVSRGTFRQQYESGAFVRIRRGGDGTQWEARLKNGFTLLFGGPGFTEEESGKIATYLLAEQLDLHGHRIRYEWDTSEGQALLESVTWNDFSDAARLKITLSYQARPDVYERFSAGIRQVISRRLTTIEVTAGGQLVRRCELAYADAPHSLLSSIKLVGADGVTALPSLDFTYTEAELANGQLVPMKSPPGRSPAEPDVTLADLNGDSLPDLLVGQTGQYRSYVNHDGITWKDGQNWAASQSPSLSLSSTGVQLADLDGDGAIDLVAKSGTDAFRYLPGQTATSFSQPVPIRTIPNFTFEDPDVRLADMDGDRRTDVVITTEAGLAVGYNINGQDWTVPQTIGVIDPRQPLRFSDKRTQLCDVNGDRVQDLCYLRSQSLVYWLGRGRGRFEAARTASNVPAFDDSSPWELHDLNGDGWVDLVHVDVTSVSYTLAEAAGKFGAVRTIASVPARGLTTHIEFADMNGSGSTDVVWIDVTGSADQAWRYLELFPDGRAGLLKTIDNGLGKRTTITYEPAALSAARARDAGQPWTTRLNVAMPVVRRTEVDASLGDPVVVTEYDYSNGTWDPKDRTFAGFGGGTDRELGDEHTPTLVTESIFDTGLVTRSLRGSILTSEEHDETGRIFTRTTTSYTPVNLETALDGRTVEYAYKSAERTEHIEGTDASAARVTLTEWTEDRYGNVLEERKWGEIAGDNKLAGNDEAVTVRTYANNPNDWILGYIASEELRDRQGNRVKLTRTYYDGEPFLGLALGTLTRADVTRVESWLEGDHFANEERYQRDQHGNPTVLLTARGGRIEFDYDANSHAFVVAERQYPDDSHSLEWKADHDRRFGQVTEFTGPDGAHESFRYDALGRVTKIVQPGDTLDLPTRSFTYELGDPSSFVREDQREVSGREGTIISLTYFDGLGRERARLKEAAQPSQWVLEKLSAFDKRDKAFFQAYPSFERSADLPPAVSRDGTTTFNDALGRSIAVQHVDGSSTRTAYGPFTRTEWDENQADPKSKHYGRPTSYAFDGLERLVAVTERDGDRAVTTGSYAYDAAGKVTRVLDAKGNARTYAYDGRSRRITIVDPNAGTWKLQYTEGDDVERRIDPTGRIVRYTYDKLGRPLEEWHQQPGQPETRATRYHYDAPSDQHRELKNHPGRLAYVEDAAGILFLGYSARGLETERIRRWPDGTEHTTWKDYDAAGRVVRRGYPDNTYLETAHDARGLVKALGPVVPELAWTAFGELDHARLGNGVLDQRAYDKRQRLEKLEAKRGDVVLRGLHYDLDAASRITGVADLRPDVSAQKSWSASYEFDDRYRLHAATDPTETTIWAYDDAGNIQSVQSNRPSADLNVQNRFGEDGQGPDRLTHHGNEPLTYDAAGRVVRDGTRTLEWDAKGRLSRVVRGNIIEEYVYAFDDTRAIKKTSSGGTAELVWYIGEDAEQRGDGLVRYVLLDGKRIARLDPLSGTATSPAVESAPVARFKRPEIPPDLWALLAIAGAAQLAWSLRRRAHHGQQTQMPWHAPRRSWLLALSATGIVVGLGCGCNRDQNDPSSIRSNARPIDVLPSSAVFYLADSEETPLVEVDASGAELTEASYQPYGSLRSGRSAAPFAYVENELDSGSELSDFKARPYRAELGIFLAPDPMPLFQIDHALTQPGRLMAFTYASGDPINQTDPTGTEPNWRSIATIAQRIAVEVFVVEPVCAFLGCSEAGGTVGQRVQTLTEDQKMLRTALFYASGPVAATVFYRVAKGMKVVGPVAKVGARWSRRPTSIQDQVTLEAAKRGAGEKLIENLGDDHFRGMEKWEYRVKSANGRDSVVHYVRDPKTGRLMDFKFKKHSTEGRGRWESKPDPKVPPGGS